MYQGSCLCRQVRYQAETVQGPFVYCHCPSCRKASGSAFGANVSVPVDAFKIVSGDEHLAVYESSPGKTRHFCRCCGSPLFTTVGDNPSMVRIRLGSLDTAFGEHRAAHIFVGQKSHWYEIADSAPQFEAWPDPAVLSVPGSMQAGASKSSPRSNLMVDDDSQLVRACNTIDVYCQAWSDPDPAQRRAHLKQVWATGATYTDPTVSIEGEDGLLAHIGKMQQSRPGAQVLRSTVVDLHHQVARFGFKAVGADGTVLREGMDIAFLNDELTRIERIVGFFGKLTAI